MTPIEKHAIRCKSQYPQDKYLLAHRALAGDRDADIELSMIMARQANRRQHD